MPADLALTIDIAGRQRMLSQRVVKEACLIGVDDTPEARARLAETVGLFDTSLAALTGGMPEMGIVAPTSREVAERLAWVGQLWDGLRVDLDRATSGAGATDAALVAMAYRSELILSEMDEAVKLYAR